MRTLLVLTACTMACVASAVLCRHTACWMLTVSVALFTALLAYRRCRSRRLEPTQDYAVLITGCDTGLGFTLALHAHRMGLTVFAACLEEHGRGANTLREECGEERMRVLQLDVTDPASVKRGVQTVGVLLQEKPSLQLKALVNNAAVMVFGEFEWQTERQIRHQVEVNLLGTMRVTHMFCSLLRQYQGRIIIVSSHCAAASLPGLATYGATKGALKNWAESLRVEQAKYGVFVINFIPGSFIDKSNIMAKHGDYAKEMEDAMSAEDKQFFGDYFHQFHSYLTGIPVPKDQPSKVEDPSLTDLFETMLLSCHPRPYYLNQPPRYAFYHLLFKVTPTWLRDWLVVRFVQMPKWQS